MSPANNSAPTSWTEIHASNELSAKDFKETFPRSNIRLWKCVARHYAWRRKNRTNLFQTKTMGFRLLRRVVCGHLSHRYKALVVSAASHAPRTRKIKGLKV